jgi:hypothetical protein
MNEDQIWYKNQMKSIAKEWILKKKNKEQSKE